MAKLTYMTPNSQAQGFTLIEVLLALAVVAIAFTALIKAQSHVTLSTLHLKNKVIRHQVAMQGMNLVQLGLISLRPGHITTEMTYLLRQRWYWQVEVFDSPLYLVKKIRIRVGSSAKGPFVDELIGYMPAQMDVHHHV